MVNRFIVPQKPTKRNAPELPAPRPHKQVRTGSIVYSDDEDAPQPRARAQEHSRSSSTARSEVSRLPLTNSRAHSLSSQRVWEVIVESEDDEEDYETSKGPIGELLRAMRTATCDDHQK